MALPHSDIIIIGGGASGLMAAIAASQQGANVRILERMDRVGKKLLITGNGRCNLSNLLMSPDHYYGTDKSFIRNVLDQFNVQATLGFFEQLGLVWKADEEKRIYPQSEQASAVLDLLRLAIEQHRVDVRCSAKVEKLEYGKDRFIATLKNHLQFSAGKVILAAGGQAMKDLGSNGSGYALAQHFGHHLIPTFPSLVKICLDSPLLKGTKGVKTRGDLTLIVQNKPVRSYKGEIQFTEDGISGIPALQLSRHVNEALQQKKSCRIRIDLLPDIPEQELSDLIHTRAERLSHLTIEEMLFSVLNKRLIIPILKSLEMDHKTAVKDLNPDSIRYLIRILKQWDFNATGTKAWNEAQVTAGGIDTRELDPTTMESRLRPSLYISGEIMNVDGDCGGYNLQWAWSTGYIAGISAAKQDNSLAGSTR